MPYAGYLYAATFVIVLLEVAFGRHRGIYDRSSWLVLGGCVILAAAVRPLAAIIISLAASMLLPQYAGSLRGTRLWIAFPAVLFASEFCFYWVHRWAHEAKARRWQGLWKLHRTHHSGKFMNVGVVFRINPFWNLIVPVSWVVGIATYLGLEQAAALTIVAVYSWNIMTHSNFRWDDAIRRQPYIGRAFRALEHVVVSPGLHHSHHGYGRDGTNFRNYAIMLSLYDWMFGTLHIPSGRPWKYGVPGPNPHWTEEVFYPFALSRVARPMPGDGDRPTGQ